MEFSEGHSLTAPEPPSRAGHSIPPLTASMQSRTPRISNPLAGSDRSACLVAGQDGWRCRLARSTVKCRQTGRWAINAAGWGRQAPSVPELECVLSSGLIARDQIPCAMQATAEGSEDQHGRRRGRVSNAEVNSQPLAGWRGRGHAPPSRRGSHSAAWTLCSAGRAWLRDRLKAVSTNDRCENACGKLPSCRFDRGSYSSASRPTSFRNARSRSKRARASSCRPCRT
jgi:hypothetical protein